MSRKSELSSCVVVVFLVLAFVAPALAANKEKKEKKKQEPILSGVGFSLREFSAPEGYNWRGSSDRALGGIIWYPSDATADAKDQYIGPPGAPIFYAGRAAKDSNLLPAFSKFPLIVLSHGTGGSAMQMAWLGTYLASRGYIVAAINHPGNNAVTGYTTPGFAEGWLRANDMSVLITDMLADPRFGSKIDPDRIGAAGFSYGGYTMMELAGATSDVNRLLAWCENSSRENRSGDEYSADERAGAEKKSDPKKDSCNPDEMPDLMAKFNAIRQQPEVLSAIQHAGDSYRDPRIRAVFAMAPAVARAFAPESLQKISIPVEIVAGAADTVAPPASNAQFFAANIKNAQLTILPGGVGHYTFLDVGTDAGKKQLPNLFVDNPEVDREAVHKQVAEMAAGFFDKELTPPKDVPPKKKR